MQQITGKLANRKLFFKKSSPECVLVLMKIHHIILFPSKSEVGRLSKGPDSKFLFLWAVLSLHALNSVVTWKHP